MVSVVRTPSTTAMDLVIAGSPSPVVPRIIAMVGGWRRAAMVGGCRSPVVSEYASAPDGPVLDCDVVHGEISGVARRQASIDASGGRGNQAVGLVKCYPSSGELAAPPSSANSFGRTQRCTP